MVTSAPRPVKSGTAAGGACAFNDEAADEAVDDDEAVDADVERAKSVGRIILAKSCVSGSPSTRRMTRASADGCAIVDKTKKIERCAPIGTFRKSGRALKT